VYTGSGGRRKGKKPSRLYRSVPGYQFLPEGSLSFRKHSPRQSADIRIARQGCPEEFSAGFLLSITAPHYTTQKYIVAVHFIPFRYDASVEWSSLLFSIRPRRAWHFLCRLSGMLNSEVPNYR
jgi:hypothetical protein